MGSFCILVVVLFIGSVTARSDRLVGGSPTTIEQYPAVVQVEMGFNEEWAQACGGNILTTRTILSAALCFDGQYSEPRFRRIRAGATYRNTGGVVVYVEQAYNHPTYSIATRFDGDISLVRLRRPLVYSNVIQRTAIPPQNSYIPDNLPVTNVGWGALEECGEPSEYLRDIQIYTVNHQLCSERFRKLPERFHVTENMICASILDVGGKSPCNGDNGGPLYFSNITIGIISWGHGCDNATFPSVNTDVSSYTNWIVENAV